MWADHIKELVAPHMDGLLGGNFGHVFGQSFALVAAAEVFDKTWFVALVMTIQFGKRVSFVASSLALQVHVILAAAFGFFLTRLISHHVLALLTFGLYATFFVMYMKDYWYADADSDAFAAGTEEASSEYLDQPDEENKAPNAYGIAKTIRKQAKNGPWAGFSKCFMTVFIAEWGDRTQIAMIGQHASQPLIPVCAGSALAFLVLTASAVVVAGFVQKMKLSERYVSLIGATSFFVFAMLELRDGLSASKGHLVLGHKI